MTVSGLLTDVFKIQYGQIYRYENYKGSDTDYKFKIQYGQIYRSDVY